MQTPTQAARRRDDSGRRLPTWREAAEHGVYLRRAQLSMLVAAPGVGKSVIMTSYAIKSGVRCLYLSMDTDAFTTSVRLLSAVEGYPLAQAESGLGPPIQPWAEKALANLGNLHYAFTSSPDEVEIAARIMAYREAQGDYPDLVVVDNLGNIAFEDEEFSGLRRLMRELQTIAGRTTSSIMVLHHATGEYEDGNQTIPLRGISGKLSKFPSLILTANREHFHETNLSVVKHRFGPADPAGQGTTFRLYTNLERVQVGGEQQLVGATS